jgi:alkylated DNA repair dioxygenase AlkB
MRAVTSTATQSDLFAEPAPVPAGLGYQPDAITSAEERDLVAAMAGLPFKEFEFQGFLGKRRVVSFGWRYDFNGGGLTKVEPIPAFLFPARAAAARVAGLEKESLQHVLLTEYQPGATIGWHKDRPNFEDVIGLSLLAPCPFRLRRKRGKGWERYTFTAEPRSVYLLRGPARTEWEHSIPALPALRYSITFRSLKADLKR